MEVEEAKRLKEIAKELRVWIVRMLAEAGSGHPGGSLSAIDILTVLYFHTMRHRPQEPQWPLRDRFILSKGHGVPALYSVLAKSGYFPMDDLLTLRKTASALQGHPSLGTVPGIEASTGSLGQGLSIAQGLALASKMDGTPYRVFCLIGDGESQEGQIWETAMSAPKFSLDNLIVFLDYNKGQIDGHTKDIMDLEPVVDKWNAFNWHVQEIDGHDIYKIIDALEKTKSILHKPHLIVAHTVKGKGVSFMENNIDWHGKAPTQEEARRAIEEIQRIGIE
ncbi:MAG: transketolase [Elusimicrobia bacterium]|nr:transketolase [Elusimicrobiota bacterium]